MANKNGQKIFISLVIGVIVACVSLHTFSNMKKELKAKDQLIEVMKLRDKQIDSGKYSYLTATHDMEAGTTITEDDVKITAFASDQPDAMTSKEMVIGNVLLEPVKDGQLLTEYVFTGVTENPADPTGLRDGYRALTLATSTLDGMSASMKQGALIDVFSKAKGNSFVLSKVRILSLEPTDEKANGKDIPITQAKSATLEVPVNKIQELVEIYSSGKILLVMRPANDETVIVGTRKSEKPKSVSYNSGYHSVNYNYTPASLPPLPITQVSEDPTINALPAPVTVKKKTKTVELIEANNKTQVDFD